MFIFIVAIQIINLGGKSMGIFKRKQTKCTQENGGNEVRKIRCDEVYVLTTEIISNHDDGSGWGPQCVTF